MKKLLLLLFLGFSLMACKNNSEGEKAFIDSNISEAAVEEGKEWVYLFDGTSTEGWRMYNGDDLSETWIIEDGTLKSLGTGADIGGDIVYDADTFGEFELVLDWKVAEGGNSGIFYHVVEDEKYTAPYFTAPEYQLIDQIGFPQELESWQSLGGDYGMYVPDYEGVVKPAGEWNTSRIVFTNDEVTYWLNGKKTVEFVPWSDDWTKRKSEGKWKDFEDYGVAKTGLIGLQDHGNFTWFKNIKIRKL